MKKEKKSGLINLLEEKYKIESSHDVTNLIEFTLIVDVMLLCRQIQWTNMTTFEDFIDELCKRITYLSKRGVLRIDFVFDSFMND